jgi:hypothetical protein
MWSAGLGLQARTGAPHTGLPLRGFAPALDRRSANNSLKPSACASVDIAWCSTSGIYCGHAASSAQWSSVGPQSKPGALEATRTQGFSGGSFMPKLTSPLDHVKIAAPCSVDWDQMFSFEDKRVRFCAQCNLNVYNLSGMSRREAEALITKTEGRLCVRFYRRADGSILTRNCPVGLKAIKRRVAWVAQFVLGMVLSLASGLGLYIFHLGRKSYPMLDNRPNFDIESPVGVTVGFLVTPVQGEVVEPRIGRAIIEPRPNSRETRGKAKRQDKSVSQAAPESSSATSPSPSRKNP